MFEYVEHVNGAGPALPKKYVPRILMSQIRPLILLICQHHINICMATQNDI